MAGNSVSFTNTSLTPGARENADLTNALEKLKLQQALAAAKSGTAAGNSPGDLQASRLAAALQQQQNASGLNRDLQTQRLQVGSQDLYAKLGAQSGMQGAQLAAQLQQLQTRQAGDRVNQGDRIQSTEKINTQNLAAQLQRQGIDIAGKKDLQASGSLLDETRKKDAAARALALFRSTPGKLNTLNVAGARAELG